MSTRNVDPNVFSEVSTCDQQRQQHTASYAHSHQLRRVLQEGAAGPHLKPCLTLMQGWLLHAAKVLSILLMRAKAAQGCQCGLPCGLLLSW